MASPDSTKNWNSPWSFQEIVDNADNWNLACDTALLNTLKSFASNITSKANEVNDNLVNLCNKLEQAQIQFDFVQNEFNSLKNSQFVECRVNEDDEILEEDIKDNEQKDETNLDNNTEKALEHGIKLVEKYYEKFEVDVSDSEDESSQPSFVLKMKDLYVNRPLGYKIGSKEWYDKWHVGLIESSDSEEENEEKEEFSDSESEIMDNTSQVYHSDVSSELNITNSSSVHTVGANMSNVTQNDSSSYDDSQVNVTAEEPKVLTFAEQLAQKLGNVIVNEPEVNRRPIQKQTNYHPIISDVPPPLEEKPDQLFSGGKGLFDDDDDEDDMWFPSSNNPPTVGNKTITKDLLTSVPNRSIFDESESDEDMFSSNYKKTQEDLIKNVYLPQTKPYAPLVSQEPPSLESSAEKKKPIGGVSIFGSNVMEGNKIGNLIKNRKKLSSSDESDSESTANSSVKIMNESSTLNKSNNENKESNNINKTINKSSLFKDDNSSFFSTKDDADNSIKTNSTLSPNTNDIVNLPKKDDLFDDLFSSQKEVKRVKKVNFNLFKDEDFEQPAKITEPDEKKDSSLVVPKNKKNNLFDDDLFGDDLFADIDKKFSSNLFESDDLFGDVDVLKSASVETKKSESLNVVKNKETSKPSISVDQVNTSENSKKLSSDDLFGDSDNLKSSSVVESQKSESLNVDKNSKFLDQSDISENDKKLSSDDCFGDKDDLKSSSVVSKKRESLNPMKKNEMSIPSKSTENDNKLSSDDLFGAHDNLISSSVVIDKSKTEKTEPSSEIPNKETFEQNKSLNIQNVSEIVNQVSNKYDNISAISYVDTNPPPDDTDDFNNSSNDVFVDTHSTLNAGHLEFDYTGPLSLVAHDQDSGMASRNLADNSRDASSQRNQLDSTYSFHPVLSSSRRFSAEVYNEEDSVYSTKNSIRDISTASPNLDIIPEDPSSLFLSNDNLEITPSGFEADLYSSESVKEEKDISSGKDNIVKDGLVADKINEVIADNSSQNLSKEDQEMAKKVVSNKIANLAEKLQSSIEENKIDKPIISGLPGKLTNRTLNINVGALLPGAAPRRKISSPEGEKINETRTSLDDTDFKKSLPIPISPPVKKIDKTLHVERSTSFEDPPSHEVLGSVTKERVRAPVTRRPSSRRARQQSLRNSVSEFRLRNESLTVPDSEQPEDIESIENKVETQSISVLEKSPVLTENLNDKDELHKTLLVDTKSEIKESTIINIEKNLTKTGLGKSDDLFSDAIVDLNARSYPKDVDDLFADITSGLNESKNKKVEDLFNDEDDDDLFSSLSTKNINKSSFKENSGLFDQSQSTSKLPKNDLFDSPEKDLFSTIKNNKKEPSLEKSLNVSSKNNVFDSPEKDLFTSIKNTKAKESVCEVLKEPLNVSLKKDKSKVSLFDSDSDDDFLSNIGTNKSKSKSLNLTSKKDKLFEDEDDDDLFSSKKNVPGNTSKNVDIKVIKSTVRKLENKQIDDDPLSSLLD